MKATSKFRPPHSSAERPLQGVRGSFFISKLPAYRHYIIKCSIFLQFYAVLESAQKCALLRAKGLRVASIFGTSGNHQKTDLKANAYIQNHGNTVQSTISLITEYALNIHVHVHVHTSTCTCLCIHVHVHTYKSIGNTQSVEAVSAGGIQQSSLSVVASS